MIIAVIPARGGSKRIPKKNIKNFNGKPIIAYSIEAAIKSNIFDQVIVSTDCEDIAKVAKEYGANVPFIRPKDISDDFTGTNAVVRHAIEQSKDRINLACCIYATAPFVTSDVLKNGFELISNNDTDYAITVTSYPFPIQRSLKILNSKLDMNMPEHLMTRSQDLEEMYHDAGQVYWGKAESFLEDKPLFSGNSTPIYLERHRVQDIDTPEDWIRAEMLHKVWIESSKK